MRIDSNLPRLPDPDVLGQRARLRADYVSRNVLADELGQWLADHHGWRLPGLARHFSISVQDQGNTVAFWAKINKHVDRNWVMASLRSACPEAAVSVVNTAINTRGTHEELRTGPRIECRIPIDVAIGHLCQSRRHPALIYTAGVASFTDKVLPSTVNLAQALLGVCFAFDTITAFYARYLRTAHGHSVLGRGKRHYRRKKKKA